MTALAIKHRDEIIERVASGEHVKDIARSIGYADHTTIAASLFPDPQYRAARWEQRIAQFGKAMRNMRDSPKSTLADACARLQSIGSRPWRR